MTDEKICLKWTQERGKPAHFCCPKGGFFIFDVILTVFLAMFWVFGHGIAPGCARVCACAEGDFCPAGGEKRKIVGYDKENRKANDMELATRR